MSNRGRILVTSEYVDTRQSQWHCMQLQRTFHNSVESLLIVCLGNMRLDGTGKIRLETVCVCVCVRAV